MDFSRRPDAGSVSGLVRSACWQVRILGERDLAGRQHDSSAADSCVAAAQPWHAHGTQPPPFARAVGDAGRAAEPRLTAGARGLQHGEHRAAGGLAWQPKAATRGPRKGNGVSSTLELAQSHRRRAPTGLAGDTAADAEMAGKCDGVADTDGRSRADVLPGGDGGTVGGRFWAGSAIARKRIGRAFVRTGLGIKFHYRSRILTALPRLSYL